MKCRQPNNDDYFEKKVDADERRVYCSFIQSTIYIYIYTGVLYVHLPRGKNRIVEDEANRQVPLSSANIVWLAI